MNSGLMAAGNALQERQNRASGLGYNEAAEGGRLMTAVGRLSEARQNLAVLIEMLSMNLGRLLGGYPTPDGGETPGVVQQQLCAFDELDRMVDDVKSTILLLAKVSERISKI